jgi:hypothetical protein
MKIFKISSEKHREMMLKGVCEYIDRNRYESQKAEILLEKLLVIHDQLTK